MTIPSSEALPEDVESTIKRRYQGLVRTIDLKGIAAIVSNPTILEGIKNYQELLAMLESRGFLKESRQTATRETQVYFDHIISTHSFNAKFLSYLEYELRAQELKVK